MNPRDGRPQSQWGREHRHKRVRAGGPAPSGYAPHVGDSLGGIAAPSVSGRPRLQLQASAQALTERTQQQPSQNPRPGDPRKAAARNGDSHQGLVQAASSGRGAGAGAGRAGDGRAVGRGGHRSTGAAFLEEARERQTPQRYGPRSEVPRLRRPPPDVTTPAPRESVGSIEAKIPRKKQAPASFDPRTADRKPEAIDLMTDNDRTESESEDRPRHQKRPKTLLETLASSSSSDSSDPRPRRASSGSSATRTPNTTAARRGEPGRTWESELSSHTSSQKSISDQLTHIFNNDAGSDDGSVDRATTSKRKQNNKKPEVQEIVDVDDDQDGHGSDRAEDTGKRMMEAIELSQAEVYSPRFIHRAWNAAKSVCSSVATTVLGNSSTPGTSSSSTLGLTKQNGLKRQVINSERASGRLKSSEPSKILPGASIQNRSLEEKEKSRPNDKSTSSAMDQWWLKSQSSKSVSSSRLTKVTNHTSRRETRTVSRSAEVSDHIMRRDTRSASRNAEVFELDSGAQQCNALCPSRIAIGRKISVGVCLLKILRDSMSIECSVPKGRITRSRPDKETESVRFVHKILLGDIQDLKIYLPSSLSTARAEEDPDLKAFLAVQAKKTSDNKLSENVYSNAYNPDSQRSESKFIVIEFESEREVDGLIAQMISFDRWIRYTEVDYRIRSWPEAVSYGGALGSDATVRSSRRSSRPKGRDAYPFLAGKDSILTYPFDGDTKKIERAAKELSCLGGSDEIVLSEVTNAPNDTPIDSNNAKDLPTPKSSDAAVNNTQVAKKIGSGTVTLSVDDFLLLEPGEWLNDNLIDFALRWISRHNDGKDAHFFSTHFYTKLADHGVKEVARWTSRKNREVNVFEKKMIFVPVNKALHWSLCVIVNPGRIKEFIELQKSKNIAVEEQMDVPCLLFFDSLKSHNKDQVVSRMIVTTSEDEMNLLLKVYALISVPSKRKNIHKWLNAEWERLMGDKSLPFTDDSMKMYCPKVPRQNNFCDCGVFVCRYAYALYQVGKRATLKVCDTYDDFKQVITNSSEFKFNMSEIKLLREQLLTLIEKLHEAQQASKEEKPASPEDEESGEKVGAMIRSLEDQLDSVNHELQMAKIPALNISQIDDDFASSQGTSYAKTDESSKTSGSNPWSACLKESQESVVAMEIDKPEKPGFP